ncbi:hypothetical protein VTO42DRAFT_6421 [Malbranchea cinnamomea]
METQDDSIDLAYLKEFALDFINEPSRVSANHLTSQIRATTLGDNVQHTALQNDIVIATETVDMTVIPAPNPPRNGQGRMAEGVQSQTENWNVVPHTSSGNMFYPSSVGGDTQPISQSVYEGLLKRSHAAANNTRDAKDYDPEYTEGGVTQKTLTEGDTGHLDLLAGLDDTEHIQDNDSDAESEPENPDEIENSPPNHYEPFPESQRFLDRTPAALHNVSSAAAGNGDAVIPTESSNPFPTQNKTPSTVMALSQLFNATQAASSPLAHGVPPDPSSDMPSPNLPIQSRFTSTNVTSPLQMISSATRRQFIEPQTNYVSVKESQAARENLARSARNVEADNASDDGFDREDGWIQHRIRERRTEEEVRRQFASVTAPSRAESSKRLKRTSSLSPSLGRQPHSAKLEHHSASFQEEGMTVDSVIDNSNQGDSEVETEQEDENFAPRSQGSQQLRSSGEEDKENVESGPIHIQSSASRAHDALSQALYMEEGPLTHHEHRYSHSGSATGQPQSDILHEAPRTTGSDVRVVNSQPDDIDADHVLCTHSSRPASRGLPSVRGNNEIGIPSSSPSFKSAIRSSPPPRFLPFNRQDGHVDDIPSDERTVIIESSTSHRKSRISEQPEHAHIHTDTARNSNPSLGGTNKQQIPSSCVFETPTQDLRPNHDPQKTIPETSPSSQLNLFQDTLLGPSNAKLGQTSPTNAEDGLHPRSTAAPWARLHTPRRHMIERVSTVLSSPSGRLRRRLTEIAAEESPRQSFPEVSLDEFGLVTAEDREFQALISEPEAYPTKKQKTNDGKSARITVGRREILVSNSSPGPINVPDSTRLEDETVEHTVEKERENTGNPESVQQQETQEYNPDQGVAKSRQKISNQNGIGKQRLPRIAVVIRTPRNSSPSSAKTEGKDSPDPLHSEASVGSTPQKRGEQPIVANRVLAFFNGRPQGYFPGTCVGISKKSGRMRYLIRFEDSDTTDEVEPSAVKRLELRVNDVVKVDCDHVPKIPLVVVGFRDRMDFSASRAVDPSKPPPMTDIHGYKSLVVKPRHPQSLPKRRNSRPMTVPISSIYLDKSLWARLGERPFTFKNQENEVHSSIYDPAQHFATNSRRPSEVNSLFSKMAFAVSYKDKERQQKLETLITRNGGRILSNGFDELFETPLFKASTSGTPVKLNQVAEQTGFTCLITDEFSRRYKYLQALALNLPCLSGRWIEDCVLKKQVLGWEFYLLAAGTSSLLDNAVRSRNLTPYSPSTASLSQVVDARSKLLAGQSVLLHMDRGKAAKEREPSASLIYALGPDRVSHVQDLKTAMEMLRGTKSHSSDQNWDWIYLGDRDSAAAARIVLAETSRPGLSKPTAGKKRGRPPKRPRATSEISGLGDLVINGKSVKILDNEILCQSLILGKMLD